MAKGTRRSRFKSQNLSGKRGSLSRSYCSMRWADRWGLRSFAGRIPGYRDAKLRRTPRPYPLCACLAATNLIQQAYSLRGTQDLVQLGSPLVQFLPQFLVALPGVPANFLVGGVRHLVKIRDVRLQLGLAVPDGRRDEVRCESLHLVELRGFVRFAPQALLGGADACDQLIDLTD